MDSLPETLATEITLVQALRDGDPSVDIVSESEVYLADAVSGSDVSLDDLKSGNVSLYLSPYFITDTAKMTATLEDCVILLHEKKLTSLAPMVPLLEAVMQANKQLLVMAEDVDGEALATLVVNKLRGGLKVAGVKAPGFPTKRAGNAPVPADAKSSEIRCSSRFRLKSL